MPVAVIENPKAVAPDLVSDIETQAQEVAYLAGVLAGRMTKTGTVGVVVSGEPPTWNYMTVGFAEGLKAANGSAKLLYSVIGEAAYDDAAGAKRVTEQQLAAGADIIFGMGDGASFGMIEAIRDFNKAHKDAPGLVHRRHRRQARGLRRCLADLGAASTTAPIYKQMIEDSRPAPSARSTRWTSRTAASRLLDLPDDVPQESRTRSRRRRTRSSTARSRFRAIGDADGVRSKPPETRATGRQEGYTDALAGG